MRSRLSPGRITGNACHLRAERASDRPETVSRLGSLSWPANGDRSIESDNTTRTAPVLQMISPTVVDGAQKLVIDAGFT